MYRSIIRPLLFLISPEKVHNLIVILIKALSLIPFIPSLLRTIFFSEKSVIEKELFGIKFKNPVGLAAGFDKNAEFYKEFSVFGFGFIEIGTLTPKPQPGNEKPRLFRLPKDMALINRMGFNNIGVDEAVKRLKKRPKNLVIGGNIGKNTATRDDLVVDDYIYCFTKLYDYVDYFVVNVSCPNIGDISKLQDQETLEAILGKLAKIRGKMTFRKPILLKISPDLNFKQIDETIAIVKKLDIDGIVAVNTTITRDGLITPDTRIKEIGNGGLSGAPLNERSNTIIRYIKEKTGGKLPVIGSGGIISVKDAVDKLDAGADLLQIYTGFIYEGPWIIKKINKELLKRNWQNQ